MMLVTDLIVADHRTLQRLFQELEEARPPAREQLDRLVEELELHAEAEEAVFYTAVREVSRRIDDAEAAHQHLRALVEAVLAAEPGSRDFAASVTQLKQSVLNHALEEEGGVLPEASRLGRERLEALAKAMEEQKTALRTARRSRQPRAA